MPALRRDFRRTCCYCTLDEDETLRAERDFVVEHFRARAKFIDEGRAFDANRYDNLYYACGECNGNKGDRPAEPHAPTEFYVDPCHEPIYPKYVQIVAGSHMKAGADPGPYMVTTLALDRRASVGRMLRRRACGADFEALEQRIGEGAKELRADLDRARDSVLRGDVSAALRDLEAMKGDLRTAKDEAQQRLESIRRKVIP